MVTSSFPKAVASMGSGAAVEDSRLARPQSELLRTGCGLASPGKEYS